MLIMAPFQKLDRFSFHSLMASSEVDQKFLGRYAKETTNANPYLSAMLYKVLGLSVLLSKKLIRARRLRRLDTTRDTKSLQLYHHIIWLAREGLTIVEEYVLPMVDNAPFELRVLSYKLRASFYHIYVLFHNHPSINQAAIPSFSTPSNIHSGKAPSKRDSLRLSPTLDSKSTSNPFAGPPGLTPVSVPRSSAAFLLPTQNYIPRASYCFRDAALLSDTHLSGSHPIRLSVKTEFAAYLYDCLHDGDASRKLAQAAIRDVYNAPEGMDDDMFEDAAEMVGILGKMMKRGLGGDGKSQASGSTSGTPASTPKARNGAVFDGRPEVPMKATSRSR